MPDNQSQNDPTAQWPEEVRQAYEHLKVPSLYDVLLANEKLSLEMRRQDRELKAVVEGMQGISSQLNALLEIASEEWEEYEGNEGEGEDVQRGKSIFIEYPQEDLTDLEVELLKDKQAALEKQAQDVLIETHDAMLELSRMVKQMTQQLLTLLPKKEGIIPREPSWYRATEALVQGVVEGMDRSRYQLLARLEEVHIEVIDPKPGDAVDESQHHILEHISGEKVGTIAQVIRVGYRQDNHMLRPAEVTVYQ
jgi:molecular chaperone GrpE (heat shock protein)